VPKKTNKKNLEINTGLILSTARLEDGSNNFVSLGFTNIEQRFKKNKYK